MRDVLHIYENLHEVYTFTRTTFEIKATNAGGN